MDPPWAGRFVFTVDGLEIGAFTEVGGLTVSIEVEEYAEGGQNQYTHRLPGRMKWPNLVLKRGMTNADNLFAWFAASSGEGFAKADNKIQRRSGAITLQNSQGRPVQTWKFVDAYPVKWTGPRLAATSRDLAVEELEVCHCGFTMEGHR
ncbi:phage tail protein [Streptomyces sp. NRRL S-118]|uniref:phage tail protein n=1 Tax=Streptomyces sp. NRRL S-118 TaxID=1463881 RepID=UPI000AA4F6B6|nr:phage tail protein [Streptomyces sp. NRRL S-118]